MTDWRVSKQVVFHVSPRNISVGSQEEGSKDNLFALATENICLLQVCKRVGSNPELTEAKQLK
jgi:hypothetical protein